MATNDYDVIVIGGGTAGVVAAIQAGRAGARTLLVEKTGVLGGTLTNGGVNFPASFHAWGKRVIAGIGWELVGSALAEEGRSLPEPGDPASARPQFVEVSIPIFAALCDEAALDAKVDLLFHAMPAAIAFDGGAWRVDVCGKGGLRAVTARVLIDASGDANAVALAGLEVVRPDIVQPGTLVMHTSGYDCDALDFDAINAALAQAVDDGRIETTDIGWGDEGAASFLRNRGHNRNHITAPAAETSEGRTAAEIAARRSMMRMYRFFRAQPGLERFTIDWIAPECGIRETVVIRGKGEITEADYTGGRMFDDAVCYSFYPVDIHRDHGQGIDWRPLEPGTLPTIPRGAMLPAGSRFCLVAGRCIAGDRVAHSAYRIEATCMAVGQAAGAMGALAAETGTDPEDLPVETVRDCLRAHGAIAPPDVTI